MAYEVFEIERNAHVATVCFAPGYVLPLMLAPS